MLNEATYQGRTTTEIEERMTSTGKAVCSFTLAVNRDYDREKTDWIDCVAWGDLAATIAKNVRKGTMILVKGSTQTRNYDDKDGNRRKATELVVQNFYYCEKKADGAVKETVESISTGYSNAGEAEFKEIPVITEDDLPF